MKPKQNAMNKDYDEIVCENCGLPAEGTDSETHEDLTGDLGPGDWFLCVHCVFECETLRRSERDQNNYINYLEERHEAKRHGE